MIKDIFIKIARFYLNKINKYSQVRDLVMWPLASRVIGDKYKKTVELKNGLRMKTDLSDMLGRMIIFYGSDVEYFWEPQTVRLMELLIKNAQNAIIAGSHLGYTALMARKAMAVYGSALHSFEPVPYLYNIAKKNFELNNNLGKMIINKEALSNNSSDVMIKVDNICSAVVNSQAAGKNTEKVKAASIDEYIKKSGIKSLDFILLDVEGHEPFVFDGMEKTLNSGYPKDIIFEYSPKIKNNTKDAQKVSKHLKSFGYALYIINDNYKLENIFKTWGKLEIFGLDKNIKRFFNFAYFNVLATRRSAEELKNLGVIIN